MFSGISRIDVLLSTLQTIVSSEIMFSSDEASSNLSWDEVFDFPVYPEFDVDFEDNNLLFSNEETVPEDLHDLPSSGEGVHNLPSL